MGSIYGAPILHMEMKTVKVTVVSPTYNEAENVPRLVHEVEKAMSEIDYELLIADDIRLMAPVLVLQNWRRRIHASVLFVGPSFAGSAERWWMDSCRHRVTMSGHRR